MIQRIQSVYILLGIISTAATCYFPFFKFSGSWGSIDVGALSFQFSAGNEVISSMQSMWVLVVLIAMMGSLIFALLSYKNRKTQVVLIRLSSILSLVSIGGVVYLFYAGFNLIPNSTAHDVDHGISIVLPLVVVVLNVLAIRGIQKDEALIRSVDRLR